jgi:hypothetical protein
MLIYDSINNDICAYIQGGWKYFSAFNNSGVTLNTTQIITAQKTFTNNLLLTGLSSSATTNVVYVDIITGYLSYGLLPATVTWESLNGDGHTNDVINSRLGFNTNDLLYFFQPTPSTINTKWSIYCSVDNVGTQTLLSDIQISNSSVLTNIPTFNDVLAKDNTISYTPSSNYHPATKKYVDDKFSVLELGSWYIGDITGDDELFTMSYSATLPTSSYNIFLIPRMSSSYDWNQNDDVFLTVITKTTTQCSFAAREVASEVQHLYVDYVVIRTT